MLDIVQVLSSSFSSSNSKANFLKWREPKTGEINGVPISKNATVWIDTADFKPVRAVLNKAHLKETGNEIEKKRPAPDDTKSSRKKTR